MDDYLPISMLSQYEYCPRRFWYMHVLGEMAINEHVLEGTLRHERAHATGAEREGETQTLRHVYVYSDRLCIAGFVDLVEETGGEIHPVEYKKGRMGHWLTAQVQLCAQALCLEERLVCSPISLGYIFYFGSRHREEVRLTPELRAKTEAIVAATFELLKAGKMPPPLENYAKCRDCSLEPICLPREVRKLVAAVVG